MENENQNTHRCNRCGNYTAFYIMKDSCFEKVNCGLCRKCNQIKDRFETCDKWKSTSRWLGVRTQVTERALRDMTTHLMAICKILQEEKDEKDKSRR